MLTIGLTGGIGSGKSTVARLFSELGVPVIDADAIARDLVPPGSPALNEITAHFGPDVLTPAGELDRDRLRALVFAQPAQRRALEAILHPRIYAEMRRRIQALDTPYCVAVIPLLLETGQRDFVDRVLVVDATEDTQRRRVRERDGLDEAEIQSILQAQFARRARLAAADDTLSNEGDLAQLRAQTEALHRRYLRLATATE